MKEWNMKTILLVSACAFGLTGCNGYEVPAGLLEVGNLSLGQELDTNMAKVEQQIDEVNLSVAQVESQLNKITLSGLSSSSTQQGLDKTLHNLFDKLTLGLDGLLGKLKDTESKLRAQMLKLDPSNPLHIAAFAKINEALSYLDRVQQSLDAQLSKITDRIHGLLNSLDDKVAAMDPKNPLSWVVSILWAQVRSVLVEQLAKIDKLIP